MSLAVVRPVTGGLSRIRPRLRASALAGRFGRADVLWRTHSCVPCRDSSRHLLFVCDTNSKPSVETSLDAARTSARATSYGLRSSAAALSLVLLPCRCCPALRHREFGFEEHFVGVSHLLLPPDMQAVVPGGGILFPLLQELGYVHVGLGSRPLDDDAVNVLGIALERTELLQPCHIDENLFEVPI